MQSGLIEFPNHNLQSTNNPLPIPTAAQHGPSRSRSSLPGVHSPPRAPSTPPDAVRSVGVGSGLDVGQLDQSLGRLSVSEGKSAATTRVTVAGQRIFDYESAAIKSSPRKTSHQPLGFKVSHSSRSDGVQLTDFPNEILTQILSHLHPDSHGAVALVSKRFYALVTTPYAWRAAFLRYFAGQDAVPGHAKANQQTSRSTDALDVIRSEVRYFTRLTALASWRSEYLLRTRLLRSVVRGKPGSIGASTRSSQSGKKASAVLTYNSKLPWMISHVHADFTGGKKGPRVIHGTRDLGVATVSDPTTGRIEKWGLEDPFSFQQLDEIFPNLEFYGVGDGPAAVPNVMDVSQSYGLVGGEGFPGGHVYYKAPGQLRGRYLGHGHDQVLVEAIPEIPKIPGLVDAISSIWIAKSSSVTSTTQAMIGIMAGSTLGVVTSYALGNDSTGPRYAEGDMTARWVLSPGVPIIDIKVDDQYCQRRKAAGRIWAVALNALGEVYYLTEVPAPSIAKGRSENPVKDAWNAGRTAYWEMIESTRRTAPPDEFDKNMVSGTYSPRSSANSMNLSKEQVVAEAREIEQFFRHPPAHFKRACQGWDMLRKLEVDFASGNEQGSGETIVVITCGNEEGVPASVRRFVKGGPSTDKSSPSGALTPVAPITPPRQSIFGGTAPVEEPTLTLEVGTNGNGKSLALSGSSTPRLGSFPGTLYPEDWRSSELVFKHSPTIEITASAVDMSNYAVMTAFEDPLLTGLPSSGTNTPGTPTAKQSTGEIPGRRARLLAIGTNAGSVVVWNMRDIASSVVHPLRVIQTESPEITALAVSALYLVHGGSDSLVQAWDPLASSLEPIRTLNAKSSGRIPRHILAANPALQHANYFAVRGIFLDPDPTVLRGILAFGTFIRFWTYSSTNQAPGRKRRLRHSDIHGRLASRRNTGTVSSYIAAEEAELRHEQEHRSKEIDRLRKRFGVGFGSGELTEEEALQYAQMISQETFLLDEQRRASDTGGSSTVSVGEMSTGSEVGSVAETVTPEPSLSGRNANGAGPSGANRPVLQEEKEGDHDDYEAQIQRAIRLSLLEGVNDAGEAPHGHPSGGSGEWGCEVQMKTAIKKGKGKGKSSSDVSPVENAGRSGFGGGGAGAGLRGVGVDADEDLALALRLSLEEEKVRQRRVREQEAALSSAGWDGVDEYPPLESKGKGKGDWA
ncbi:hypothetical protein VTI74DRAFT_21 [Chaetomium olivicolor]